MALKPTLLPEDLEKFLFLINTFIYIIIYIIFNKIIDIRVRIEIVYQFTIFNLSFSIKIYVYYCNLSRFKYINIIYINNYKLFFFQFFKFHVN